MNALPLILDTDIGDDIDDALALALILASPELDLRGVTTVFRNAPRRAILARQLLKLWQQDDVIVAPGISNPLLSPNDGQLGAQFEMLEEDSIEDNFDASELPPHGVDFLVSQMQSDEFTPDNPLIIAPIGPLTNIALGLAREPELISRARLVLMGGSWRGETAEWNIKCDPEAAAIVFRSGIAIDMIGLDVTQQCQLSPAQSERIAQKTPLLGRLMEKWARNSKPITLHDPLAILTLLDDSLVQFEDKRIEVQLCGDNRGKTLVVDGEANCRAAISVDAARATQQIEAILLR